MANFNDSLYMYQVAPSPNKTIACQDLLQNGTCIHSGWLRRQSMRNRLKIFAWPQVYVVIAGGCVYCYSHERARRPATAFSLYGYDKVFRCSEVTIKEATWAFKVVHANMEYRSYHFSASSEKEMGFWMKVFKQEMLRANGKLSRTQGDGKASFEVPTYQDAGSTSMYQGAVSITSDDYSEIEANIYEDSSQFVLPADYTNKREDEESDDEMSTVVTTRPDLQRDLLQRIEDRPPQPPPVPGRQHKKKQLPTTPQEAAVVQQLKEISLQQTSSRTAVAASSQVAQAKAQPQVDRTAKPTNDKGIRKRGDPDGSSLKKTESVESEQGSGSDSGDFWSTIFFYGGKDKAAEIIKLLAEEGVYLIRVNEDKSMVLHVFANGAGRKFQIFQVGKMWTLKQDSDDKFKRVEELVYFYYTNPLPKQEPEVLLTECYIYHPQYHDLQLT